jgi:hypothetical protein
MKQLELREIGDDENFDPSNLCDNVPFTQASFYGDWQKSLGRTVKRFLVYSDKKIVAYFQLIEYPLLLGKSYFYIPYGPVIKDFSEDFFANLKPRSVLPDAVGPTITIIFGNFLFILTKLLIKNIRSADVFYVNF